MRCTVGSGVGRGDVYAPLLFVVQLGFVAHRGSIAGAVARRRLRDAQGVFSFHRGGDGSSGTVVFSESTNRVAGIEKAIGAVGETGWEIRFVVGIESGQVRFV